MTVSRRGPQVSSILQSDLGSSVEAERPARSWARSGALTEIWGSSVFRIGQHRPQQPGIA